MDRKRIPIEVETAVLTKSARRCTLCFLLSGDLNEKHGQIAHIDQDPSNYALDNLAFMCLEHHSLYDSRTSQHKNYTIAEVKAGRVQLYEAIAQQEHCITGDPSRVITGREVRYPTAEPRPRLQVAGARISAVGYNLFGVWREWDGELEGILLEVRNLVGEIGETVGTAEGLAIAIGGDAAGANRPNLVARAYWLGREGNEINLHPGDKCDALLAIRSRDVLDFYENRNRGNVYSRRRPPRVAPNYQPIASLPLDSGVRLDVRVIGVDRGETLIIKTVDVDPSGRIAAPPSPVPTRAPTVEEYKSNLIFLGARSLKVDFKESRHVSLTIYESTTGPYGALIASFRNEPVKGRRIEPLYAVTAQLIFTDEDGAEIGNGISGVHWLEEGSDSADLTPGGQTRSLVLLVSGEGDQIATPWKKHTRGSWMGAGVQEDAFNFDQCPQTVTIRLLSKNGDLLHELALNVALAGGVFSATLRQ